ncbi:MAG: uracil-DNA glycosylase [Treponema sp.]|nr:uracil-DNA glycosylase [Treponema sp.]
MTSVDKRKIADFLDLAGDFLGSGYKREPINYQFDDNIPAKVEIPQIKNEYIDSIELVAKEIRDCKNCSLCEKRTNAVPGEGVSEPLVMVIGEGPGEEEDKQGRPFVGKAGMLLDKMLDAIGLSRNTNAFIANVIKCRPPLNRDPHPEETSACSRFLERQITLLNPKFILVAGKVAANTLFKTDESISKHRAKIMELTAGNKTYPLICTYHPAALLRSDDYKRPAWEDLKLLKSKLDTMR